MNKISQTTVSIKNENYLYSRTINRTIYHFIASKKLAISFIECSDDKFLEYANFYQEANKIKRDI